MIGAGLTSQTAKGRRKSILLSGRWQAGRIARRAIWTLSSSMRTVSLPTSQDAYGADRALRSAPSFWPSLKVRARGLVSLVSPKVSEPAHVG